jgi:hypothetical protein
VFVFLGKAMNRLKRSKLVMIAVVGPRSDCCAFVLADVFTLLKSFCC